MTATLAAAVFLVAGTLAATNEGETDSDRHWWRAEIIAAAVAVVVWAWAVMV